MANNTEIGSLTERLIAQVTNISSSVGGIIPSSPTHCSFLSKQEVLRIRRYKQLALRLFTDPSPARTNPFEVEAQLAGLEEKFRILNNDELADVLKSRLLELAPKSDRWTPEVLSLLLQLSDQPAKRTKIEDLDLLKPEPLPSPLTWSQIISEDPFDNQDGTWDIPDFAADGSDEDEEIASSQITPADPATNLQPEDDGAGNLDFLVTPSDSFAMEDIVRTQSWRSTKGSKYYTDSHFIASSSMVLTETQVMREVIFMLLGLPTSIFVASKHESLTVSTSCQIKYLFQDSLRQLLQGFISLRDKLLIIRNWLTRQESVPLMQTLQSALALRMRNVDNAFSAIQGRMIDLSKPFTASLLSLFDETNHITRSVQQVAQLLAQTASYSKEHVPFRILELLHSASCKSHSIGDVEKYKFMATLFFDCFHTYLKPVMHWMKFGDVSRANHHGFFVRVNGEQVAPSLVWQKQHHLVQDESGYLHAPRFLDVAAKKIFTTGKSVNFLRMLGQDIGNLNDKSTTDPQLDYRKVCDQDELSSFSPFSELFGMALETWIGNQHSSSSHTLRLRLESQCGLRKSLDALEYIYFSRNGALASYIMRTIFDRMDRGVEAWNDGFLLTELFQSVFGAVSCIEVGRLAVRPSYTSHQDIQTSRRSVKVLETIRVWYTLPWPVANIIKQESIRVYQRIFIFLMQAHRAKHMLERERLINSKMPSSESEHREGHLVFTLRHRLLWFSNTLIIYLTDMVLATASANMRANMTAAEDVDGMIAVHEAYVSNLEQQCLIDERLVKIRQDMISILDLVIMFSDARASYTDKSNLGHTNRSVIPTPNRQRMSLKRDRKSDTGFDSSDEEAQANDDIADLSYIHLEDTSYSERLLNMHARFTELLSFIIAGLHDIHRSGGEPWWEALADSLVIGIKKQERWKMSG